MQSSIYSPTSQVLYGFGARAQAKPNKSTVALSFCVLNTFGVALLLFELQMNQLEAALEAQQCRDMLATFLKLGPEGEPYTAHSTLFASNITRQHAPSLLTSQRASFKALRTDC
jgi:hypothetical protein